MYDLGADAVVQICVGRQIRRNPPSSRCSRARFRVLLMTSSGTSRKLQDFWSDRPRRHRIPAKLDRR